MRLQDLKGRGLLEDTLLPPEDVWLFWPDRPDNGMIYFQVPDESRVWRCDYVSRKPRGPGFDSRVHQGRHGGPVAIERPAARDDHETHRASLVACACGVRAFSA